MEVKEKSVTIGGILVVLGPLVILILLLLLLLLLLLRILRDTELNRKLRTQTLLR